MIFVVFSCISRAENSRACSIDGRVTDPEGLKVILLFKVFVQLNRMHLSSEAQTFTEAIAPCTASVSFFVPRYW